MRTIAALCVSGRSIYKHLPDVEAFDERRDAWTFKFDMPVVAHPPCRCWSKFLRHQAKPKDRVREMELGLFCGRALFHCGGVLEQPKHSYLVAEIISRWGNMRPHNLIELNQSRFGYATTKPTWILIVGEPGSLPDIPAIHFSNRLNQLHLSKFGRSRTLKPLAEWLCQIARLSEPLVLPKSLVGPYNQDAKPHGLPKAWPVPYSQLAKPPALQGGLL